MGVLAALEPSEVKARPGSTAEVRVRVRNDGAKVDGFILSIVGPLAPFATIEPLTLRLPPASEAEATVSIRAPRQPIPGAGTHALGVSVRSVSDPGASVVEEGEVDVAPFVALASELEPRMSGGRRTGWHTLSTRNVGNDEARVTVRATSSDEALQMAIKPAERVIAPGEVGQFRVRVRPRRLRWRGRAETVPYMIELADARGATEALPGVFEQRGILPGWLIAVAILAILGGIAVAVALVLGIFGA